MDLPAESQIRWILSNTATLLEHGAEPVRGLILPTGEFFPDRFDGSPQSVAALMSRVQDHAGLTDLEVEVTLVTPEGEAQTVSCSSGACGGGGKIDTRLDRVARHADGGYTVTLSTGEVKNPVVLTTTLVRAVATMFMIEADAYAGTPLGEREPLTDLAAVLLGFGVLMSNGSYIYMKGCSGVQVHAATKMPADEIALALGIFCRLHDVPERTAAKHLELTPSEHFDESYAWASSNHALMKMLRKSPASVRAGEYTLQPARSWLARVLGVGAKKRPKTTDEELAELERDVKAAGGVGRKAMDPARAKKLAELKALVDESLEE
ncbi:hypothetical protein A7982_12755 [Minicystis rosea]|nr:hypothetical protein A7982_12755 [Minicystis rosea]